MTSFASDLNILFSRHRERERIQVSALRDVIGQSEPAGTEALLGLAEQHPVPDSPIRKKFWKAVGFFSMPMLAHPPNSLIEKQKFNK